MHTFSTSTSDSCAGDQAERRRLDVLRIFPLQSVLELDHCTVGCDLHANNLPVHRLGKDEHRLP
eukprot:3782374-Rhodomonas_salina.1